MEHHLTGERRLYNVVTDYGERENLASQMPEKISKLKKVMDEYLESIDAENVQDVYEARFAELDQFEKTAREVHKRAVDKAMGDPVKIAEADERLQSNLISFDKNRKECRENMQGKTF